MTTPTIPTFDTFKATWHERLPEPYDPKSERLHDGPPNIADSAGKQVVLVGDAGSGKSELINGILGIPKLCKTAVCGEPGRAPPASRVKYSYRYHDDTNIAASIDYFAPISPVAVHVSHSDEAAADELATKPQVKVVNIVRPDIASFHAAISEYTDSPKCVVNEVRVSVKSSVLEGGAILVELPDCEYVKDHELGDRYLVPSKMADTLNGGSVNLLLREVIRAAKNGVSDISLLVTHPDVFVDCTFTMSSYVRGMLKNSNQHPFPAIKAAMDQNNAASFSLLAIICDENNKVKDNADAKRAHTETLVRKCYNEILLYHGSRACVFSMIHEIQDEIRRKFKDPINGAEVEVKLAAAIQYPELMEKRTSFIGVPLLKAQETGLPDLRRWLRNL